MTRLLIESEGVIISPDTPVIKHNPDPIDEYIVIVNLPEGYETHLGTTHSKLSVGQKQRIAIARALYNDPSILIFDESTSALDVETENNLLDSIYNLKNKKTLIIISHKESILNRCDTIYKIENKKIVKIK